MRIISMVPSWTETLIEAGIEVVGRTRFCIHPAEKIKNIPVVGGTKDISWEKVGTLKADFLLLDKEENPLQMDAEAKTNFDGKVLATHVRGCSDVISELRVLSSNLKCENLNSFAYRWELVLSKLRLKSKNNLLQLQKLSDEQIRKLGIQCWICSPKLEYDQVVYVIWKGPYMAVTNETFVGSMLELVGLKTSLSSQSTGKLYPQINLDEFEKLKTLFLFSSEPYPFHKKIDELKKLNISSAIVDGEVFSWFGLRSLEFLEAQFK